MTETIYSRPGVVEAIDVHGRPFGVPLPGFEPGQIITDDEAEQEWQRHVDAVPMREPVPDDGHPFGAFAGLRTVIVGAVVFGVVAGLVLAAVRQ